MISSDSFAEKGTNDDREIYSSYRNYAREWLKTHECTPLGLHLFFWNGKSQIALTYQEPQGIGWHRRYVFSLDGTKEDEIGEANLDVAMLIPGGADSAQRMKTFCSYASLFDQIACTLEYSNIVMERSEFTRMSIAMSILIIFVIVGVAHVVTNSIRHVVSYGALIYVGILIGQYLVMVINREARIAPLRIAILLGTRLRLFSPATRLLEQFAELTCGITVWTLLLALHGFLAIIVGMGAGIIIGISQPWYWIAVGIVVSWLGLRNWTSIAKRRSH